MIGLPVDVSVPWVAAVCRLPSSRWSIGSGVATWPLDAASAYRFTPAEGPPFHLKIPLLALAVSIVRVRLTELGIRFSSRLKKKNSLSFFTGPPTRKPKLSTVTTGFGRPCWALNQ